MSKNENERENAGMELSDEQLDQVASGGNIIDLLWRAAKRAWSIIQDEDESGSAEHPQ